LQSAIFKHITDKMYRMHWLQSVKVLLSVRGVSKNGCGLDSNSCRQQWYSFVG